MKKKLAIKGHPTRGNEVIELLEMMGGNNRWDASGGFPNLYYFISNKCIIYSSQIEKDVVIFTLEEFLEKYPYKIGDKIPDVWGNSCTVKSMSWDENYKTVMYGFKESVFIVRADEEWYTTKELLEYNDNPNKKENMEQKDKAKAPKLKGEDYSGKRYGYKIPDGYEFDTIVNGKIILKPIKPKYPETYKECCGILGMTYDYPDIKMVSIDECNLYTSFIELIRCRNAYWKIAGEEMGLGKPWEPDWKNGEQKKYCIYYGAGIIQEGVWSNYNSILAFPTIEMRDAFYENFKDLIESCKELL